MEAVLIVLDGVAFEADVADLEPFEHTHADEVDHAVGDDEVGEFQVPHIAEVERGSGAGVHVEDVGVFEVGASPFVAVPDAAGDMDGGVAEGVVAVGQQKILRPVVGFAAVDDLRPGIGLERGKGIDLQRAGDAIGPRRNEHLFAPAVQRGLNRGIIIGDAVPGRPVLSDIVNHPKAPL
ncbi:hypothetical protein SDC9_113622 [bioreactor metagenome]|uniref:Uncharacterized protein n=1 Tax=bioreactor metagenome TaxID=1076179 RepID=A0A645BQ68_9ZZZZ